MNGFVSLLLTCMVIAVVIAAYLLPALIAWLRHAPDTAAVIAINLTLGWTILGWWVALALALRKSQPPIVQVFSQVNAPVNPLLDSGHWTPHAFADDSQPARQDPRRLPPGRTR